MTEVRSGQYLDVRPPKESKRLQETLPAIPGGDTQLSALQRSLTAGGGGKSKSGAV